MERALTTQDDRPTPWGALVASAPYRRTSRFVLATPRRQFWMLAALPLVWLVLGHLGETLPYLLWRLDSRARLYGVKLGRAEIWDDYRRGALHGLTTAVFSAAFVARTERGDANFLSMARGACALALAHDSLGALKGEQ